MLTAGVSAVAVGTLLLRSDESGATRIHKDALADPAFTDTVITRAFTGRPARALRNRFADEHGANAPAGYPAIHHLTRSLRQAAAPPGTRTACTCGPRPASAPPPPNRPEPSSTGSPSPSDHHTPRPRHDAGRRPGNQCP